MPHDRNASLRAGRGLGLGLLVWLAAAPALAHGRPQAIGSLIFDPDVPGRVVGRATFGLVFSDDGASTLSWSCAAAYGVDARSQDPILRLTRAGTLLLATFDGLLASDDGGCTFEPPSPSLEGAWVIDLERAFGPDDAWLAVTTGVRREDALHRSDDGGRTWRRLDDGLGVLLDSVAASRSEATRIYVSGRLPAAGAAGQEVFIFRSDDAGESFERLVFPLEEREWAFELFEVDPTAPGTIVGRVRHFRGEAEPERVVRSTDGGESWETVLSLPFPSATLRSGDMFYIGSRLGGLHRSIGGEPYEVVDAELPVTCLAESAGELWACVDQEIAGYALARARDGERFERVLALEDIAERRRCPACTPAEIICPAWEADIIYDLGIDAPLPPDFDPEANIGGPRDAGLPAECGGPSEGCDCRAGRGSPTPGAGLLLLLATWLVLRRRRRTSPRARVRQVRQKPSVA